MFDTNVKRDVICYQKIDLKFYLSLFLDLVSRLFQKILKSINDIKDFGDTQMKLFRLFFYNFYRSSVLTFDAPTKSTYFLIKTLGSQMSM